MKIIEKLMILLLVLFSFYYTDKLVTIAALKDPIMEEITKEEESFSESPVNAVIKGDYLIPGYSGLTVDKIESFTKMQKYGDYNESLLVFDEVKPTISKEEYYDKYIISGNGLTNTISLVFKVDSTDTINKLVDVLKDEDIRVTIFIDGKVLEEENKLINLLEDFHEVEVLNYDNSYERLLFETSLDKLQVLKNERGKYCYAEYDHKEVLELCSKLNMHTIIPTIKIDKNLYSSLKGNVKSGSIISINPSDSNLKELKTAINYLLQRGYTLDTIDNLLEEGRNSDK